MKPLRALLDASALPESSGGKEANGTVVVIGGPPTCPGAVMLAGEAALRVGSGRVQLVVHPDVAAATAVAVPETKVLAWDQQSALPADLRDNLAHADVVVVGPGHAHVHVDVVSAIAEAARGHLVLDAGALDAALPVARAGHTVITAPNTGEAAAMLERDGDEAALAQGVVDVLRAPTAVRGPVTVVAGATDCWLFDDSPPGLGTPGSGDVFVGVLAGLLACGAEPLGALAWSVALHAEAGAQRAVKTPVGYTASDILHALPFARAVLAAR